MIILALDLSLTATGYVVLQDSTIYPGKADDEELGRGTIKPPTQKRVRETDADLQRRRYQHFRGDLQQLVREIEYAYDRLDLVVAEVSSKAMMLGGGTGRYSAGTQYRAGLGLGRALGWLEAICEDLNVPLERMETNEAKFRITGNRTADKEMVAWQLEKIYGWPVTQWDDAQTDALAVGLAWFQNREHEAKLARLGLRAAASDSPTGMTTPGAARATTTAAPRAARRSRASRKSS